MDQPFKRTLMIKRKASYKTIWTNKNTRALYT